MTQPNTGPRVNPADETVRIGMQEIRFLVTGAESHGSVALFEITVPAGDKLAAPPHSHDAYEETIYVTEGTLTWTVDGNAIEVGTGEALCIPRGAVHQFANHGSTDAKAMCVISPGVLGPAYFRQAAEVINAAAGGPPDRARMTAVMHRHGLTPAPPRSS